MRRLLSTLTAAAMAATVFAAIPQGATAAEAVPAQPHITDPVGDGNYLNDQGDGSTTGDNTTGQDVSSVGDIKAGWFTADAGHVYAHIQTEAPGPATASILFRVQVNPNGAEASRCLWFQAALPGAGNIGEGVASLRDTCPSAVPTSNGELILAEGPDGTGIITIKMPRSAHPMLANGVKYPAAIIHSRNYQTAVTLPQIDTTKPGLDYTVKPLGPDKPQRPKPKVKPKPKPKPKAKPKKLTKKACMKLEGKARKACLKKLKGKAKPKSCAAFKPGEAGKDAPVVKLTDAASEAKPVEQAVTFAQSTADVAGEASYQYVNIQVDSKAKDAGLYALLEFPARNDYDLNLLHPDGSYAARSRAFNTIIELNDNAALPIQVSTTGHGGESTASSEKLVGIKTKDCGGWTLEAANYLGQGGDMTIKLWLGDAKIDPQEPGAETPS